MRVAVTFFLAPAVGARAPLRAAGCGPCGLVPCLVPLAPGAWSLVCAQSHCAQPVWHRALSHSGVGGLIQSRYGRWCLCIDDNDLFSDHQLPVRSILALGMAVAVAIFTVASAKTVAIDQTIESIDRLTNASALPHIIFALVDDNGWAGVGYNNPHLHTPTLDSLAGGGLKLTSHYTYKYCAPTRGAFLTGRLPYRLAATRANFIPWQLTDGTHLSYSMLPRRLKAAGYHSSHIGKWFAREDSNSGCVLCVHVDRV